MIKRILVPLDGSDLAESAIPYAEQIATKTGAEVLLLTSVYQDDSWQASAAHVDHKWAPLIQTYLETKAGELRAKGITATNDIASGPAAETILARVVDENVDLIAMCTHGRSGVTRWVLGSVADKVLHATACPILLVRPASPSVGATKTLPIGKILIPLDGSEHSLAVLPFVEELAKALDASLFFFHVLAATYFATEFMPVGGLFDEQLDWAKQLLGQDRRGASGAWP